MFYFIIQTFKFCSVVYGSSLNLLYSACFTSATNILLQLSHLWQMIAHASNDHLNTSSGSPSYVYIAPPLKWRHLDRRTSCFSLQILRISTKLCLWLLNRPVEETSHLSAHSPSQPSCLLRRLDPHFFILTPERSNGWRQALESTCCPTSWTTFTTDVFCSLFYLTQITRH